jgi:aryl-alcohol dehydrogenase
MKNVRKPALEIQAAVIRSGGGPLVIEPVNLAGPRDNEMLVRIVASGICHTDIGYCYGWSIGASKMVLGHEGCGVVEQVGKKVKGFAPGDHVVVSYQSCGSVSGAWKAIPGDCLHFFMPICVLSAWTARRLITACPGHFLGTVFIRHLF